MNASYETVGAAGFRARCLQIMDLVKETGAEVTITKHGYPVARLVPITAPDQPSFTPRFLQGPLIILDDDDLVPSTADEWSDWEARVEQRPDGVLSA